MCTNRELPLALILGFATVTEELDSLSLAATSQMRVSRFEFPSPEEMLEKLLEVCILNNESVCRCCCFNFVLLLLCVRIALKLERRLFLTLSSQFLHLDYSVAHFVQGMNRSLLNFFLNHPFSILCCNEQELNERLG